MQMRIASHASRSEKLGLGFAASIQKDIEVTIERIWRAMQYGEKLLVGDERGDDGAELGV
jgi:pheromone shutdown protein TraB